ncbi:MAG: ADP-ribosylglycohydrolase family protein, partial [Pseudomonadota bacterium]
CIWFHMVPKMDGLDEAETGRTGTTNGAAMRIAPVGIAFDITPVEDFVDQVELACRLTHNTGEAIAAAAAVAAVISCGLTGCTFDAAVPVALEAASSGQRRGHAVGAADVRARIESALSTVERGGGVDAIAERVGTSVASYESVAAAFALVALAAGDPWRAALLSANSGDDTDTMGAIAGAMAGACSGSSAFPERALDTIQSVNTLNLPAVARDLVRLRESSGALRDLSGVER